jgi:hypothetical protein
VFGWGKEVLRLVNIGQVLQPKKGPIDLDFSSRFYSSRIIGFDLIRIARAAPLPGRAMTITTILGGLDQPLKLLGGDTITASTRH